MLVLRRRVCVAMTASSPDLVTSLERKIAALTDELSQSKAELADVCKQQSAASDILRAISSAISRSPNDLKPVLDAIAVTSGRLCQSDDAHIFLLSDGKFRVAAINSANAERNKAWESFLIANPIPRDARGSVTARAAREGRTIHVPDTHADPEFAEGLLSQQPRRTVVSVPLMHKGSAVGAITLNRRSVDPFTPRQIALVTTFADQAVIAIENARLFEAEQTRTMELKESLEYQTAISDVLDVISRSPNDVQPVLDTIARIAERLCQSEHALILRRDGAVFRLAAAHDTSAEWAHFLAAHPVTPDNGSVTGRVALGGRTVHLHDLTADPDYTYGSVRFGVRTQLGVPLLRDEAVIGVIVVGRPEVRPFTDKQIALLETFADQAVIAIENARLFEAEQTRTKELAESLKQQTATAEVLKAISRSTFDVQRVLDTLVEAAVKLCGAKAGTLRRRDGDAYPVAASYGMPSESHDRLAGNPNAPGRGTLVGRVALERRTVQIPDVENDPELVTIESLRSMGIKASIGTPLLRNGVQIGSMALLKEDAGAFTPRQVELFETFADQAVIAIENARLFEAEQTRTQELRESLEYQTAITDVLDVISRSPSNLQPVLDAIVATAGKLCAADYAHCRLERDGLYHVMATHSIDPDQIEIVPRTPVPADKTSLTGRTILAGRTIHTPDVLIDPDDTYAASVGNPARTLLGVPLLRDGKAIGVIALFRRAAKPFTQLQIDLVTTFASQAVIAINNVRLFEAEQARTREVESKSAELAQSLDYQTAISDVLAAISRSKFELQPVIDTIIETATRLCESERGAFLRFEPGGFRLVPTTNSTLGPVSQLMLGKLIPFDRGSIAGRVALEVGTVHVDDMQADPDITLMRGIAGDTRRTALGVPLRGAGGVVGAIVLQRTVVRPFTDRQIKLLETFADQAVIAIENARLFEEVQEKNQALTRSNSQLGEALEQQTATSDLLKVIGRSTFDLQPVFQALIESAVRLSGANRGFITRYEGEFLHYVAGCNVTPELKRYFEQNPFPLDRHSNTGRAALERRTIHNIDVRTDPEYTYGGYQIDPYRTVLAIPMLKTNALLGVILIYRHEVQPFTDSQIALIETFADQAVIAIENARLFEEVQARTKELQDSLEYQTATSEVLGVISRSPSELQPVLDTIVATAHRLCQAEYTLCLQREVDGRYHIRASMGADPKFLDWLRSHPITTGDGSMGGIVAAEKQTVHFPDALAEPRFKDLKRQQQSKARTMLGVPLLRGGEVIGSIFLARTVVQPFSARHIELVTTFANQAVIAINNVGLFDEVQARTKELQESLEYQTATSNVLGVISRSPSEVQPVFDTIVETTRRLCQAEYAFIFMRKSDGKYHIKSMHPENPQFHRHLLGDPVRPGRHGSAGRAVQERRTIHIPDVLADPEYNNYGFSSLYAVRAALSVPLLQNGDPIGVVVAMRSEPLPFNNRQIELITTFADQAVIAINNVGLFEEVQARTKELTRSVQELKALGETGRAVSSSLDLTRVLPTILEHACGISDTGSGSIYVFDARNARFVLEAGRNMSDELIAAVRAHPIRLGETLVGQCGARREAVAIEDLSQAPPHPLFEHHMRTGVRALLAVPLLHQDEVVGALVVRRQRAGPFSPETVALLQSFASQSAIAIRNARLFREIEEKGRQLEIASQHKSQFVANMSHELRTPLAAMLGYAELLKEGIYGALPEKSGPIVERVQSNGRHLLGLINTVLDISKIESGQFKLNLGEYALSGMVETVRVATESLAAAKKLALRTEVARGLPHGLGDEPRLTQVLLNLVGNAIKFTDQGEVRIDAAAANGSFTLSVSDTGPGIPPEERERIFEKFHQIDNSNTRTKGGTGLGLAIAKEIIVMHGGRIWVESVVGRGSTFRLELPVRTAAAGGET